MPRPYPFLDGPLIYHIAHHQGLWVYCACGHNDLLKPTHTLKRNESLTTWELMARLRCRKCGLVGAIESITVCSMKAFHEPHWVLKTDR